MKPKKITFKLLDHTADQCLRSEDKHTKEITVQYKDKRKKKLASEALLNVNSSVPPHFASMYLFYLHHYLAPGFSLQEKFLVSVHTCAYFADKHYPTLDMRVYPDLVWIANLQYNFKEKGDYFFHNKNL